MVIIGQRSSKIAFGANIREVVKYYFAELVYRRGTPLRRPEFHRFFSAGMGVFPPPCGLSVLPQQNITEHGVFAANEA